MRTLNATFEGILQGDIHRLQGFVAKITGLLKSNPATTRTFYFAESFDEIDSSAVDGLLYNVGSIRQQIDFYSGSYSFGGFNIEVMQLQDTINDIIADYHFTNQSVEIYYFMEGATRNTTTPVLPKLYVGKIESIESDMDRIVFCVANDARLLDKDFPPSINDADAGDAVGKVARYVYGSHNIYYGKLDASGGTGKQTNNLVKCHYAGIVGGNHRWILCGNGADVTIANYSAIWFWDGRIGRYVQLADSTVYATGTDTQGNRYIDITASEGYLAECYDFIMPDYSYSQGTYTDFADVDKAIDGNWGTYSYLTMTTGTFQEELALFFPNVPDYTITEQKIYCKTHGDENIDSFSMINYGATLDVNTLLSFPPTEFNDTVVGTVPTTVSFQVTDASGDARADVYYCFFRIKHQMVEINDMYVECSNTLDTQREIIEDICTDAGITYTDNTDVPAVTLAPVLDQQRPVREWLSDIAKNGACTVYITDKNECTVDIPDLSATADITINSADVYNVKVKQSKLSDVVNDMNIDYYQDNFSDGFTGNLSDDNSDSDTLYDTREKIMKSEMLFNATDAGKVLDYYVNGTTNTFFSGMRNVIEFELRDLVGTTPYQSGTFKAYIQLELGDYFLIDSGLDTYIKCNGESWDGKVFKILYLELSVGKMKIKAIEI